MIKNCPVCGKAFFVEYPQLYRYKREKRYMCSYSCMRALDDKEGRNRDMALTKSQKQLVIEMLLNGENPNEFIKNCGIKNPTCTVWNLKQYLKKYDHDTWEKLQPKPAAPAVEIPETNKAELVETPESVAGRPIVPEPDKQTENHRKDGFTLPAYIDGFEVVGIRGSFGTYRANDDVNYFDFTPYGGELCMSPKDWRDQLNELQRAAKILGVEL